jgi:TolB-like protein/Tfp pilus assembly protein PilF
MSLYQELKRRNVFRVAIAYLAGAWLLTEVAGTLFPAFGIPDWGVRFVVIVFALGFVPALIISWAYELTPEGLMREKEVVRDESITHLTAKRLDGITISLIVVALLFILADRFWLSSRATEQAATPAAVADGDVLTSVPESAESQILPNSIAVLPFINRSANPDDAYFVDGIHDDLLTHISKIGAIRTISRTSVMQYRNSDKTIPEIAGELGVSTVLEGGVQRAGAQIRINVQLIDAQSDEHLWAEIYDRQLSAENIFAIQSEISRAISEALQAVLSPTEQRRIEAIPTKSLEAYEAYLFGKQQIARRTTDSLDEAVEYLTQAVEIDPQFALAWSALGDTYLLQRVNSGVSENELLLNAQSAIDKALEIDPQLGEAHTSLGMLQYNFSDEKAAEQSYRKAIELAPNYPRSYHWYSVLLRAQGRDQEAFEMISTAAQLDPLSPIIRMNLAVDLRIQGRNEEALEELEKIIEIDPAFPGAYDAMATIEYQVFNRMTRAAQGYVKAIQLSPGSAGNYVSLEQLYLVFPVSDTRTN